MWLWTTQWVTASTNINICHLDPDSVLLQREWSGSWVRRISLQSRSRSKDGDLVVKIDPSPLLPLRLDLVRKSCFWNKMDIWAFSLKYRLRSL